MSDTQEYVLRAMARNYADGNSWDHLDRETVLKAADEIKALRAANKTFADCAIHGNAQDTGIDLLAVRKALDAIQSQCDEMRSLKGWRLNLIRENLAKAYAALSTPSTDAPAQDTGMAAPGYRTGLTYGDGYKAAVEQCAKIADPWPGFNVGQKISEPDLSVIEVRNKIAAAIRALATPSTERSPPTASSPADSALSRRPPE